MTSQFRGFRVQGSGFGFRTDANRGFPGFKGHRVFGSWWPTSQPGLT